MPAERRVFHPTNAINEQAIDRMRSRIAELQAELLAAQEREKELTAAYAVLSESCTEGWRQQKALREAARSVQIGLGQTAYEGTPVSVWSAKRYERILADALAGSPSQSPTVIPEGSEKPGSEEELRKALRDIARTKWWSAAEARSHAIKALGEDES